MYIVEELTKALGGKKLSESHQSLISGWTPNNVKAIFISVDFILVVNHLGYSCKVVPLDRNLVASDIEQCKVVYGKPKLNSVLEKRSFSCLEEIYVDAILVGIPQLINIEAYINSFNKDTDRLRYAGAGDFNGSYIDWIRGIYSTKQSLDYAIAKDTSRPFKLQFKTINEDDWYKHYYLRPKYYRMDSEKGGLAMHFRKFAKDYSAVKDKLKEQSENSIKVKAINKIVEHDVSSLGYLTRLQNLINASKTTSSESFESKICMAFKDIFTEEYKKAYKVEGLTKEDLSCCKIEDEKVLKLLFSWYKLCGVCEGAKKHEGVSLEVLEGYLRSQRGFLNIDFIVESFLSRLITRLNDGYKELVVVTLVSNAGLVPSEIVGKMPLVTKMGIKGSDTSSIEGMFILISELVGKKV